MSAGVPLKVAGALSGAVYVDGLEVSVQVLRNEVARLLDLPDASGIKLIVAGRTLADDSLSLETAGVKLTSRMLVVAGAQAGAALTQAEAKEAKLQAIQRVLNKLTNTAQDLPTFELENQAGEQVKLNQDDRKALVQGVALHDLGKAAFKKGEHEEALRLWHLSEQSFTLAHPDLLGVVDNLGMLLLDIVWCCYKLNDARRLAVAKEKLTRARAALEKAYGPGMQRLRQLHGNRCPELAIYARLEALEAVAAYHSGDLAACEAALQQAQKHWTALQVSDLKLAQLQDMGYPGDEACRALKLTGGDIDSAITFIMKQREDAQVRCEKQRKEEQFRRERKLYGRTPEGTYVNQAYLERVISLGYGRPLAAQALRLLNNHVDAALELLLGERCHEMLVQLVSLMQTIKEEEEQGGTSSRGVSRHARLLTAEAAVTLASLAASVQQEGHMMTDEELLLRTHSVLDSLMRDEPPSTSQAAQGPQQEQQQDSVMQDAQQQDEEQEGDAEMEQDVRAAIQSDAMASYDLDVQEEGDIIQTYTALCASARATTP